mgnify:CR=1 FL=1
MFLEGNTHSKFPLKIFFLPKENLENNLAAFAVPKRNFKSAVDRNRVKRQLREAYRLNKQMLEEIHGKKFVMLFLYLGKVKPQYADLEMAMVKLLKKLMDENNIKVENELVASERDYFFINSNYPKHWNQPNLFGSAFSIRYCRGVHCRIDLGILLYPYF